MHINFIGYIETKKDISISGATPFLDAGVLFLQQDATQLNSINITADKAYFQNSIDKKVYNIEKDIIASNGSASDALQTIPS